MLHTGLSESYLELNMRNKSRDTIVLDIEKYLLGVQMYLIVPVIGLDVDSYKAQSFIELVSFKSKAVGKKKAEQ